MARFEFSRVSGWRNSFAPGILLVFLAGLAVALATGHLYSVRQSRHWISHSHEVIEATQALAGLVQDVESGERGFIVTGDNRFLSTFDRSRSMVPAAAAKLEALVRDNPGQAGRVARMEASASKRIEVAVKRVELGQARRMDLARTVQYGQGQAAMEQLRATVGEVMRAEDAVLAERTRRAEVVDLAGFATGLTLGGLAIAGLGLMMDSMTRANRRLQHEIAEREGLEAARREGEALYRAVFDTSADLLYVVDVLEDGVYRIAQVNPAFERAVGSSLDHLQTGQAPFVADDHRRLSLIRQMDRVCAADQPVLTVDHVFLPSGERIWESVLTALRDPHGAVERIVGSSRDVTERELAQEQLRRGQRLEAIGQLTGGIAHDFNNLLQVIRGNLELLSAQVGDGPGASRIKNALHASERAAQLTRQLLAFARRQPLEPRVINLGRMICDMTEILQRTLGESIRVKTRVGEGLWNTLADPAQVESAVLNLALNSRDAMPDGGDLTIELANTVLDDAFVRADTDLEPGEYVLISVSDTGRGMDKATLKRVFEPFFTTKSADKGTGLGLSMVYGFVKQSHGHVQMFSEPRQGATVKIYLPRERKAVQEAPAPPTGPLLGASEVILVVEDDELVRASAVGMLRELGYSCVHAADGASALKVLEGGAKVDLVFTDVVMPGPVSCRELARRAQVIRPGMPVLYTSGYTEDAIVHHGRLDEGVQLLSKPYDRETLARRISGMLKAARRVVLVVEDDPLVRMAAVDMVEALGFTPLQAGDAPSAMEILSRPQAIDVLFTDVGLPGERGTELAVRAKALCPKLKVIFASGYGEVEEAAQVAEATHLRKPYEQDQLADALASAVG